MPSCPSPCHLCTRDNKNSNAVKHRRSRSFLWRRSRRYRWRRCSRTRSLNGGAAASTAAVQPRCSRKHSGAASRAQPLVRGAAGAASTGECARFGGLSGRRFLRDVRRLTYGTCVKPDILENHLGGDGRDYVRTRQLLGSDAQLGILFSAGK